MPATTAKTKRVRRAVTSAANPKVEAFFRRTTKWRDELTELRRIARACGLTEELKWGKPCYTLDGANVIILIPLKESCALMFCQGALLKDAKGLLAKPGEHTQAGRWIKFTSTRAILAAERVVTSYIEEAIAAEKAGLEVKFKSPAEFELPAELRARLEQDAALKAAFAALTPGRRRAYCLYFSGAKQSQTRAARVEKYVPQILRGEGLHDDYKARKK